MPRPFMGRELTKGDEQDRLDGISYDPTGRMRYHPEFHPNHGKPFTTGELIYMCKYYDIDGPRSIGYALGKTPGVIQSKAAKLKFRGMFEEYKNMSDEEWEQILLTEAGSDEDSGVWEAAGAAPLESGVY